MQPFIIFSFFSQFKKIQKLIFGWYKLFTGIYFTCAGVLCYCNTGIFYFYIFYSYRIHYVWNNGYYK
ncbi:TPA: hypothetical protein I7721_19900 [Vibrio vulnificus]|nr:hypothetical protein [Vibrio vulnificus]